MPEPQHAIQAGGGDVGTPAVEILATITMCIPDARHQSRGRVAHPVPLIRLQRYLKEKFGRYRRIAAIGSIWDVRHERGDLIQETFVVIGLAIARAMQRKHRAHLRQTGQVAISDLRVTPHKPLKRFNHALGIPPA